MKQQGWIKKIKEQCLAAGTYQEHHDTVIATLASVLAKRDDAEKQYKESGGQPVIEYTSDRGSKNMVKNPSLQVIIDLNNQALAFWRELGLTTRSYKQIGLDNTKANLTTGFEEIIRRLSE